MGRFDVLVVGGSAGGLTAAITARRHYPDASIALVRKEKQVPIPCGIPYIFGTVGSPEKISPIAYPLFNAAEMALQRL